MTIQLYLGDCLEILPTLATGSVDAVVTDPPYLDGDLSSVLDELLRVGQRTIVTPGKVQSFNWIARRAPFWEYAWINTSQSLGGSACLHIGWEPILAWQRPLRPLGIDVLKYACETNTGVDHPWPKPLALMAKLIEHWTRPGQTVLDPFMGSGTTGVACVQTGRNFIGIEIDPTYYAIAEKRIAEAQMQMRMAI